ncbi:unnamed protein product [Agarophyton chilense]
MASETNSLLEDSFQSNNLGASHLSADPTSSLAAAINNGSVYTALSHLTTLKAVPNDDAGTSVPHGKLLNLLRCILPMLLLPRALARYDTSLRRDFLPLIAMVYANVHGVRNALPFVDVAHLRESVLKAAQRFSQTQVDDASAALAQAAATLSEQLCEAWSTMMRPNANVSSTDLASDLLAHTSRMRSYVDKTQKLDIQIMSAHRTAISIHHAAARIAHKAIQIDVSARQGINSYDECRARELITRGNAMSSKLKMLHAQIMSQMYTTDSVNSLRAIAKEVSEREEQLERELRVEGGRLAEYRSLGADFERIVQEILQTRQVLEQKEWSRKELGL